MRESPTGRVVHTGIKKIKIIYNNPGKQSEDQYGGDPSEDVGPPFPPVIDQQPIHVSPHLSCRQTSRLQGALQEPNFSVDRPSALLDLITPASNHF
jgi:hypothetical protein